jgi:site-specific recombinase XerD
VPDRTDTWDGGYKRKGVFVIYKRVRGKLYEISTRATSSRAANEHWVRFQADPENYKPQGEAPRAGIALDQELGRGFLEWSRDAKKNTPKWVRDQQRALEWWQEQLAGRDLRTLRTEHLVAALDSATKGRKQLIATLKAFFTWLVKVRHVLSTQENPTLGLSVPQARPKQWTQTKAVEPKAYKAALGQLEPEWRDALEVLGGTGWHVTELQRFASGGAVEKHPQSRAPVLLCPQTKGGELLRTQVGARTAAAARRVLERGSLDYFRFRAALKRTGADFNPGYMRHSVATWAINSGAAPQAVAAFLNHKSSATTKRFYATHAVPAKVPTLGD